MRWTYLFYMIGSIFLLSGCSTAPVQIQEAPSEMQQGVVLIEKPSIVGDDAPFGESVGVGERVQRHLRTTLQGQGIRVVEDPEADHHAVLRTQVTINIHDHQAEWEDEADADNVKRVNIEIDLVDGGEFLGSGASGLHWSFQDFEVNQAGYRSLGHLSEMAINDLFRSGIARSIGSAVAQPTQDAAPQTPVSDSGFASATPQRQSYALIIGVENYRDLPAPTGARGDAEKFAELLISSMGLPEQNVRLLTDENATRGDILSELRWLEDNVSAGGRVYLYFSGHGSPDTSSGTSFLLPYEATPESLEYTGLALPEIIARLEDTSARDIIAFVDACFSGTGGRSVLAEGTRPLVPVKQTQPTSRVAIFSASQAAETSGNRLEEDTGLFTHFLTQGLGMGLADGDGDGQISLSELEAYVSPRVAREARQASREQNPSLDVAAEMGAASDIVVTWGIPAE